MSSTVAAMDDNQREEGEPGPVGAVEPIFSSQSSSPAARPVKSAGAKPTRTFMWLGQTQDVSNVDFSSVEGKKIKFERSMSLNAMLTVLKREFRDFGTAR